MESVQKRTIIFCLGQERATFLCNVPSLELSHQFSELQQADILEEYNELAHIDVHFQIPSPIGKLKEPTYELPAFPLPVPAHDEETTVHQNRLSQSFFWQFQPLPHLQPTPENLLRQILREMSLRHFNQIRMDDICEIRELRKQVGLGALLDMDYTNWMSAWLNVLGKSNIGAHKDEMEAILKEEVEVIESIIFSEADEYFKMLLKELGEEEEIGNE